jgi:hypothetical protein
MNLQVPSSFQPFLADFALKHFDGFHTSSLPRFLFNFACEQITLLNVVVDELM